MEQFSKAGPLRWVQQSLHETVSEGKTCRDPWTERCHPEFRVSVVLYRHKHPKSGSVHE